MSSKDVLDPATAQKTDLRTSEPLVLVEREVVAHVLAHDEPNCHHIAVDCAYVALSLVPLHDVGIEHVSNTVSVHTAAFAAT